MPMQDNAPFLYMTIQTRHGLKTGCVGYLDYRGFLFAYYYEGVRVIRQAGVIATPFRVKRQPDGRWYREEPSPLPY